MAKLVPFDQRLWRPGEYLGDETREDRGRLADFLAQRREMAPPTLAAVVLQHPELDAGYMAEVRRKIMGRPKAEAAEFKPRLDRAVGEKR
jgi:hypothetical protein